MLSRRTAWPKRLGSRGPVAWLAVVSVCRLALSGLCLLLGFTPGSAEAVEIELVVSEVRVQGAATSVFEFAIDVDPNNALLGATSGMFQPPGRAPIPLVFDPVNPSLDYVEIFSSLSELESSFPDGNYSFEFNSGAISTTIPHSPVNLPPGFGQVTSHANGDTIPLTPTFEWLNCSGCGAVMGVGLDLDLDDTIFEVFYAPPVPGGSVSIRDPNGFIDPNPPFFDGSLAPLIPSRDYLLTLEVANILFGIAEVATPGGPSTLEFTDESLRFTLLELTTVPEASTAPLLGGALAGLLVIRLWARGRGWRRASSARKPCEQTPTRLRFRWLPRLRTGA